MKSRFARVSGLLLVAAAALPALPARAGVVIEREMSAPAAVMQTVRYEGVRAREDMGAGGDYTLILPDENRMLEVHPASRSFEEKPLGAALGELGALQRAMAEEVRLVEETVTVEKGAGETIAGLGCTRYRLVWRARVETPDGEKHYAIRESLCVSQAPAALAARKAMMRHIRALAGRFGVTLNPERGSIWLFDIGRMLLGVPALKLVMAEYGLGGFALETEREIDFGGMALAPVIRGVARQRAREAGQGRKAADSDMAADMSRMQEAMSRMQSPEFRTRLQEAMRELQDPELQAQLRQYMSPEQIQAMQQTMGGMARGEGPAPLLAGGKLRIAERVRAIRLVADSPGPVQPPADYSWKTLSFDTPEAREEPDKRDGDGALSADEIARLIREARTGRTPEGADESYVPVPRAAAPWMVFYREWEGVPYRWGGTSKQGVDCSGLTQNAYQDVPQLRIPRTTAEQIREGRRVSLRDARPGDLVFFDTGYRHVGVYVGQNKFFHASSSKGVTLSSLANPYWSRTFRQVRRIR